MTRSKSKRIRQSITQQQIQAIPVDTVASNATAIKDSAGGTTDNAVKAATGIKPIQQEDVPQSVEQQVNTEAITKADCDKKPNRGFFSRLLHWLLTPFRWLGKKFSALLR